MNLSIGVAYIRWDDEAVCVTLISSGTEGRSPRLMSPREPAYSSLTSSRVSSDPPRASVCWVSPSVGCLRCMHYTSLLHCDYEVISTFAQASLRKQLFTLRFPSIEVMRKNLLCLAVAILARMRTPRAPTTASRLFLVCPRPRRD